MIAPRFLATLASGILLWVGLFFGFTLLIDPYGVSPIRVSIDHLNTFKPARVDIDRVIKPFEVWRYQPRTVFLGTSRIHQSIDPAVLNGTRFAPAYNASIPASSLGLNIAHLQQYLELDPKLRTVVVELFLYNFLGQGQDHQPKDFREYLRNSLNLFISADTLWAAMQTLGYNLVSRRPAYEVKPGGYYYYPPGHNAKGPFDGYPAGIWKLHETRANGMQLHEPAFGAVQALIDLCRQHNVELIFVLSPNHAYDDYYVDAVGAWDTVELWLTRLSRLDANIYSFSQPNALVYERVSERMRYWNDPYHFSLEMGGAMLRTLAGLPGADLPANFAQRLTPDSVAPLVAGRRTAIREWARANPEFVMAFEDERIRWERRRDPVHAGLSVLASVQQGLARIYTAANIKEYRDVTREVLRSGVLPRYLVKGGQIENPWGGRLVAQVFPANAWGPGVPATYNYYFEKVPKRDCSKLVEALGRSREQRVFLINVEPSGAVHRRFPVVGPDGCSAGANSVGFTTFAD